MLNDLLSAVGLKKLPLIGGMLGALISLKLIDGISGWTLWQRCTTVGSGAVVAAYCSPLTVEVLALSNGSEGAVAFIGGLFGMSVAGAVIRALPGWAKALRERISGK